MTSRWRRSQNVPPAIQRGDTVGILAPSGPIDLKLLKKGKEQLVDFGLQPYVHTQAKRRHRVWAGDDEERAEALLEFAAADHIHAIWCARGGSGLARILPLLDEERFCEKLRRNPKLILGFSDVSTLHAYIWKNLRMPSVHGPMIASRPFHQASRRALQHLKEMMCGEMPLGLHSYSLSWGTRFMHGPKKSIEGILMGGNLCTLVSLAGTRWQPDFSDALLYLEDCAEPPYRIDRLLTQLWQSDMLKNTKAILLGDFSTGVSKDLQKPTTIKTILKERLYDFGLPVIEGLPIGHGSRNEAMPHGVRARITASGKIQFLQQVTR